MRIRRTIIVQQEYEIEHDKPKFRIPEWFMKLIPEFIKHWLLRVY